MKFFSGSSLLKWSIVALVLAGAAWVQSSRSDAKKSIVEEERIVKVKVHRLEAVPIADEWVLPVQFAADSETKIHSDIDGFVTKIYVNLGQKLSKNQPLIAVQSSDPVRTYRPLIITSPINGTITFLPIKLGQRVQAADILGTVADLSVIRLVAEAPELIRSRLEPGLSGHLEQDEQVEVEIIHVGQSLDPDLGTVRVELKLKNPPQGNPLSVGLISRVVLKINPREALVVPRSALLEKGDGSYLVTIDEKRIAHHVPVKILREFDGKAEIDAPALLGKEIMVQTSAYINEGETVQIQKNQEEEAES